MIRSKEYLDFESKLETVIASDGKLALPNVSELLPAEGLLAVACASKLFARPYRFRVRDFENQRHQIAYYPKIFTNAKGMDSRFDGSGVIVTADAGKPFAYGFVMCRHEWDESGANHSRGWYPAVCKHCGFDASIDSGD